MPGSTTSTSASSASTPRPSCAATTLLSQSCRFDASRVVGQPLFTVVAPCMNNYLVAQRFEDAAATGTVLDATIDYVLTLRMRPMKVHLRLLASAESTHALPARLRPSIVSVHELSLADEYETLLQFLYMAPVGLVQASLDGDIAMINPLSAQLLMPVSRDGNLSESLHRPGRHRAGSAPSGCQLRRRAGRRCATACASASTPGYEASRSLRSCR